jgi:hypothetical protein
MFNLIINSSNLLGYNFNNNKALYNINKLVIL